MKLILTWYVFNQPQNGQDKNSYKCLEFCHFAEVFLALKNIAKALTKIRLKVFNKKKKKKHFWKKVIFTMRKLYENEDSTLWHLSDLK